MHLFDLPDDILRIICKNGLSVPGDRYNFMEAHRRHCGYILGSR